MKRRAFLSFLGGAAVAGPQPAKSAAQMTVADLNLPVSLLSGSGSGSGYAAEALSSYDHNEWAVAALKELTDRTAQEIAKRKAEHHIGNLDACTASLRSVSLVNRIRISRDLQFDRSERQRKGYLEGIIAGWWE